VLVIPDILEMVWGSTDAMTSMNATTTMGDATSKRLAPTSPGRDCVPVHQVIWAMESEKTDALILTSVTRTTEAATTTPTAPTLLDRGRASVFLDFLGMALGDSDALILMNVRLIMEDVVVSPCVQTRQDQESVLVTGVTREKVLESMDAKT
jgi:hypothetical protein